MGVQSAVYEIIHETLKNSDSSLSVTALCEIAGVSRSGYYRWVSAEDRHESQEDTAIDAEIQSLLPIPQGESVSADGQSAQDQQGRGESPEP